MPSYTAGRRFIAGAVCPRCAVLDKIVVDLATDRRECVSCGFTDARPGDEGGSAAAPAHSPGQPAQELPTRVSRPAARRMETPAEPLKLVDPPKK